MSSSSSSTTYSSTNSLPRGTACFNCRRRKIKCNGQKPKCDPCNLSSGMFADCEYPSGEIPQAQLLEENIALLEMRIQELENAAPLRGSVALRDPYAGQQAPVSIPSSNSASTPSPPSPIDLPLHLRQTVICTFLRNCSKLGFFFDPNHFYVSAMDAHPLGHHSRPSPSLMYASYLWGIQLSGISGVDTQSILSAALHYVTGDLANSHPKKIISVIQAEILLSYYFLNNMQKIEGTYHANAAVSLILYLDTDLATTPPQSNEYTSAFWSVIILTNYWLIMGEFSSFTLDHLSNTGIDIPWAVDDHGSLNNACGREGDGIGGLPALALNAKASVLLKQAINASKAGIPHTTGSLENHVASLSRSLILNNQVDITPDSRDTLRMTQLLLHATNIKFLNAKGHDFDDMSTARCD